MPRLLALAVTPRFICLTLAVALAALSLLGLAIWRNWWWFGALVLFGGLAGLGFRDLFHPTHAVLRNYPISAHLRFILEGIRPEMRQYFFEDEKTGTPFSRDQRSVVYQRAKRQLDKRPFGTQQDVYRDGFEWLHHSLAAKRPATDRPRVTIGGPDCTQPYGASLLNISAMSFGSLSANAIRALNRGAAMGGFAQSAPPIRTRGCSAAGRFAARLW